MIPADARLLRVYVNTTERWHGRPLYRAIVEEALARGIAGASVFPVAASFGARGPLHNSASDYDFAYIPVVIDLIDAPAPLEALLAAIGPIIAEGLATISPVRVVQGHRPGNVVEKEDRSTDDADGHR